MTSLEWLQRRRELAVEAEITAIKPANPSMNPDLREPEAPSVPSLPSQQLNLGETRSSAQPSANEVASIKADASPLPEAKNFLQPPSVPYLTADGTLRIPFDSDPRYHWWKGGQSVRQTMEEVLTRIAAEKAASASGGDEHG